MRHDHAIWTPDRGLPDGLRARDYLREQRARTQARWRHIRDPRVETMVRQAAISGSSLTQNLSSTTGNSYNTASVTPTSNALVLVAVENASSISLDTPTLTGNGLTYVEILSLANDGGTRRLTVFRAMGASPSAGAITIAFTNNQTQCLWKVQQWTGVDTTGTNGSGALVQSQSNAPTVNVTTVTVTLSAFGDPTNNVGVCFGISNVNNTFTADTVGGWAELAAELNDSAPNATLGDQWILGGSDLAVGSTFGATGRAAAIAVELKAASAGVSFIPSRAHHAPRFITRRKVC